MLSSPAPHVLVGRGAIFEVERTPHPHLSYQERGPKQIPAVVIPGGGLSLVGESLRAAVTKAPAGRIMHVFLPGPEIRLAELGEDAVQIGRPVLGETSRQAVFEHHFGADIFMAAANDKPGDPKTTERYTTWIEQYRADQISATKCIPVEKVAYLIERMRRLLNEDRQLFVFGNGGSASNASHFVTDLGKNASSKLGRRFRVLCLNDNISWITALANDFAYDEVFRGQLINYARPGDMALTFSVSGNSPNCVKAVEWAKANGLFTAALVGGKRGRLAEICDEAIVIDSTHYGRVEDAQMTIAHMLCYGFIENPAWEEA